MPFSANASNSADFKSFLRPTRTGCRIPKAQYLCTVLMDTLSISDAARTETKSFDIVIYFFPFFCLFVAGAAGSGSSGCPGDS
jgi:hypothetical protein